MSLKRFLHRSQWDQERQREIEAYLDIEADENVARGMSYEDARAAAQRKLGNTTLVRERIYEMNTLESLDTALRDVRFCLRRLRDQPSFTIAALLTLAVGIGANTAVFSVVNSVLIKPLPYTHPEQLVSIHQDAPGAGGLGDLSDGLLLSASMFFTYSEQNRAFSSLGVWTAQTASVTGLGEPQQVRTAIVTSGVLETLQVSPMLGRWLSNSDQLPEAAKTVLLSYGYWQRHFGADPSIVGRTIRVDSITHEIVGVMPRNFRVVDSDFDLILPAAFNRKGLPLAGFGWNGIARLKPGISFAQANADLRRLPAIWMDSWSNGPGSNPHWYEQWRISPRVVSLKQKVIGSVGSVLWVVMGTILLVLLIACANVTNLLLVRGEARQQELAVRAALGASRSRIVRELLVESAVLGLLGGVIATLLAYLGLRLFVSIGPATLPRLTEISLDAQSLLVTLILSLTCGLFCGLISALKYAGPVISTGIRSASRTASLSKERHAARNVLVVAQMAIALILLIGVGLMVRTFQSLHDVFPGFRNPDQLQTLRVSIPSTFVPDEERATRMQQEIRDKLAAIPGVQSAAFVDQMPMEGFGSNWDEVHAEGVPDKDKAVPLRLYKYASPSFFQAAGIRILAGREFSWDEVYGARNVVLISENLAREFWGSPANAIGKHLREFSASPWREVIGVVENTRENGVDKEAPAIVYWTPLWNPYYVPGGKPQADRDVTFLMKSPRAGSLSLVRDSEKAVWSVEPSLPVADPRTMRDISNQSLARTSFTLTMLGIAAAMALLIGVIGVYGTISYAVSQRRREIGIRLALGAQARELKKMFVRSGLSLAAIGLAVGLAASLGLTRLMNSVLFGVSPLDPATYLIAPLVLALAALLASYFPARRAATVDPIEALKAE